jgi:hypothetical protein
MAKRGAKGRRKSRNNSVQAPQPFSDIVDQICKADKKYFEENPGRSFYFRRYVPGEFWPLKFIDNTWVLVKEIHPELRMRAPCTMETAIDAKIWEKEKVREARS